MITADTPVDEMVERYPETVTFLMRRNLPCVVCGEPFWGSLRDLCIQRGWSEDRILALVDEFNADHP